MKGDPHSPINPFTHSRFERHTWKFWRRKILEGSLFIIHEWMDRGGSGLGSRIFFYCNLI